MGWLFLWVAACGAGRPGAVSDAGLDGSSALDAGDAEPIADAAVDAPPPACAPTGDGPWWVLEGDPVVVAVRCGSGEAALPGSFTIDPVPPGATWDAQAATLTWTPGLDQAATWDLTLGVLDRPDDAGTVRIGVLDRWQDPSNVAVAEPTRYLEEYGLPVFHLEYEGELPFDDYAPATITFRGHTYAAEAKHRGGVSRGYPKRSFTLKFADEDPFGDATSGVTGRRKLVLTTTFDDNSDLRQRLAFELWDRIDPDHVQVRHFSAVVFVNGEYQGLYEATDHVDRHLMEQHGLSEDGNLYKAIDHDANFRLESAQNEGAPKVTLHDGYEKKEGLPLEGEEGAFADLEELVRFVATAPDDELYSTIDDRIDRRDYEDWWILVSAIAAWDSCGKNSYHYHDPAGGPWRVVPWDFNHSFGQDWQTNRTSALDDAEDFAGPNEIFTRLLADPVGGPVLRARYGALLDGVLASDQIVALLDGLAEEVRPSALRDEERWSAEYRAWWSWRTDFTTFDEEIDLVRSWIEDRAARLEAEY